MELLKQYIQICWFKGSPLDLERAIPFLRMVLIVNMVVGFLVQANVQDPIEAFIEVFIEVVVMLVLIGSLLFIKKSLDLFVPTLTAILVCENFILVLGVPLVVWFTVSDDVWIFYILALLVVWAVAIVAYILRQICGFSKLTSYILSFAYYMTVFIGTFFINMLLL